MVIRTASSYKLMTILSTLAVIMTISMARDILLMGEELKTGESLDVGDYKLIMQDHCSNLALYWTSNAPIPGQIGCKAKLSSFGNYLAIYNSTTGRSIKYHCGSSYCCGDYVLVLQEDRNLVLYGTSIWATGTVRTDQANKVLGTGRVAALTAAMKNGIILASTGIMARDVLLSGDVPRRFLDKLQNATEAGREYRLLLIESGDR